MEYGDTIYSIEKKKKLFESKNIERGNITGKTWVMYKHINSLAPVRFQFNFR